MVSFNGIQVDWSELHRRYQQIFYQETINGDLERNDSNDVEKLYRDELVGKILQGPTAKKLMNDKKTSDPHEIVPELYALFLEEHCHPKEKIGYPSERNTQEYLVSERLSALHPLYFAEMTKRIGNGPDFEKKTFYEICNMYRISDRVPNYFLDFSEICHPLFESGVLTEEGFTKSNSDGTCYGLFSKKTHTQQNSR